jgi:hypothetical protein
MNCKYYTKETKNSKYFTNNDQNKIEILNMGSLSEVALHPQPPKGGFITYWF